MVDRISNSPSRIPVPVKASSHAINGGFTPNEITTNYKVTRNANYKPCNENGAGDPGYNLNANAALKKKEKGFETFVMTGDMIIKTTSPPKSIKKVDNVPERPVSPLSQVSHSNEHSKENRPTKQSRVGKGKLENTNSEALVKKTVLEPQVFPIDIEANKTSRDSTGTKDSKETLSNSSFKSSDSVSSSSVQSVTDKRLAEVVDTSPEQSTSNEELLDKDTKILYIEEDESSSSSKSDPETEKRSIVASKSAEKIAFSDNRGSHPLVRTSKSHENYLQGGGDITLVNIDIDDDGLAYSMDVLSYEQSASSLDKIGTPHVSTTSHEVTCTSRSLENSPERKTEKTSERVFMPGFISLEEPRVLKSKTKEVKPKDGELDKDQIDSVVNMPGPHCPGETTQPSCTTQFPEAEGGQVMGAVADTDALNDSGTSDDLDFDSYYTQPCIKESDRPSAFRLAKRLYYLDGFKKSDVSRHLSKKNEFSTLVAEEYLKFFDFKGETLDVSLRKFLRQFSLIGETQERERVLAHFSKQYLKCNEGAYNSEDACHTLTCAIMLLNTDLHGQNIGRKMTCSEFIENLAELNDGENFSKDVLKSIYHAIKSEPIEWAIDEEAEEHAEGAPDDRRPQTVIDENRLMVGTNPFLNIPDPSKATEYKKGYVMRKCCMDADRRRTPFGKRGWKMYFATLRDMILYLHKDDHGFKKGNLVESANNAIRIHHALATKATDYTKKQHVFRLQTCDWAEYLFQTSDSKELQAWIDTINLVAASLSAPPLPGGVGSQAKFQRPLMPSSYTKLNLRQQLNHHEEQVIDLERQLQEHHKYPPEKGSKHRIIQDYTEKETYLEHELKRFRTYVYLLQSKMAAFPELEPSLVETSIGEVDERLHDGAVSGETVLALKTKKPVQRSLSDRAPLAVEIMWVDLEALGCAVEV
ncbi:PH and SEC7 domain-containing protein-like isoform X3 [Liolophura sinensis]|uniref:PH and SEC7 domain-containing protein-like isoform X3 n=1 Tax=Liolophura sinensis TaxID=3198878 RepID=UPI003158A3D6